MRHPPGNEIYRDGNLSIFEVDGERSTVKLYILYVTTINLSFSPKYRPIVETCVCFQDCSWTLKHSTMMLSHSYSMSWPNTRKMDSISLVTFQKKKTLMSTTTYHVYWQCQCICERVMANSWSILATYCHKKKTNWVLPSDHSLAWVKLVIKAIGNEKPLNFM